MTEQINNILDAFLEMLNLAASVKDKSKLNAAEKTELLFAAKKLPQNISGAAGGATQLTDDQQDELVLQFGDKLFGQLKVKQ